MAKLENHSYMKAPNSFAGMNTLLDAIDLQNPNERQQLSITKCEIDLPVKEATTDR